jgi:small GTP-binding protein
MIYKRANQITLLGSGGVGKSSILQRYLFGKYSDVYTETVEETYIQPYNINGRYHYINYIDTAGSISFPAMRQIYISKFLCTDFKETTAQIFIISPVQGIKCFYFSYVFVV